jgi:hypothetical protein
MSRKPLVLLCLLAVVASGCVAAVVTAGVAGIVYVSGEAKKSYVATVEETHQATLKAMQDLNLVVLGENRDGTGWELRSRRPADAVEVKIRLRRTGETLTEVGVRVGTLGDKDYSVKVHEAIERHL